MPLQIVAYPPERLPSKELINRSLSCALAIREGGIRADREEIEIEASEAIAQAVKTVLHETESFPLAEALVEFVIPNDYLSFLLPDCLQTLERFRTQQGRESRIFELLSGIGSQLRKHTELHSSLPLVAQLLGGFALTHRDALLEEFGHLLKVDFPPLIEEIQSQAKEMLTAYRTVASIVSAIQFILQDSVIATANLIDAAATALCSRNLHEGDAGAFDLVVQLYEQSIAASPAREAIAVGLRNAAEKAATFHELERVANVAIAASDLPHFRKEEVEREILPRLVPMLRAGEYRDATADLLHRLSLQVTHSGGVLLRGTLRELLETIDLPFDTCRVITDLVCTHESLQIELPDACATRIITFAHAPETTDEALKLITKSWETVPEAFKIRLVSEMRDVFSHEDFAYDAEYYALLLRLIEYAYRITDRDLPDRENTQLHYVKTLIRLSSTAEQEASLSSLVQWESGKLSKVLLPKSRVVFSVWFLFASLARHLPESKLKPFVDGWQLPTPPHQQISLEQISIVFDSLLTEDVAPEDQYELMRRALINALGQLADSEDEAVVEVGESVLSMLKEYLAGITDQARKEWKLACQQIWDEDSQKGTAEIDRIRSGRVRKWLLEQIEESFEQQEDEG